MCLTKDEKITLNNAIALFQELIANGDTSDESLITWYNMAYSLIESTLQDLETMEDWN